MKDTIATSLRHAFTALAGLGTYLLGHGLIGSEDAPAVNAAGASLGDVLKVVAAALVARLVVWVSGKVVTGGASDVHGWALCLCIGSLAVGGLSGCSADQLAAARAVPVRFKLITPGGGIGYSSKAGLTVDYRSGK